MRIVSVGTALPPHHYGQDELIDAITAYWSQQHHNTRRVRQFHQAVQVGGRHLALPLEAYPQLGGFGDCNDAWIRVGLDVGEAAVRRALAAAGLEPRDVDAIFTVSVTGIATPSLDARLVNRLGLRPDVVRVPIFGLGCVAGTAGVSRIADWLQAWPGKVAVLLSVELCSLTLQRRDLTVPNLIASGLFGDGGAAVVAVGDHHPLASTPAPGDDVTLPLVGATAVDGPRTRAWQSRFYPDTERVMGWDIGDAGFRIVLSAEVPDVVERYLGDDVAAFLGAQGLTRDDIGAFVCHPGGPKVLKAFEQALSCSRDDLAVTWDSLAAVGNLSSASVLFVLRDTMADHRPPPGTLALMIAMGPGFCSELVLLEW
ncbi:MAG: type III polyketide synthase [Alphaproteobacteria bacterium]|nr:type III polyketide synthase [Alphaproteobacteria bacterium]